MRQRDGVYVVRKEISSASVQSRVRPTDVKRVYIQYV